MKRARIISALVAALVLVFAVTSIAYAAQVRQAPGKDAKPKTYQPTVSYFNYEDGASFYPNEIYIPNEANPGSYRIHSNYTKNTDACAACHATHTGVGQSLLQWGSVYDACMACHDGTVTTTYDVKTGKIGTSGQIAKGGAFGTSAMASMSNHNVTGAVNIYAAPGGTLPTDQGFADHKSSGDIKAWDVKFGCESCHSPHGQGGNARILNADPNGVALKSKKTGVVLSISNDTYDYANSTDNWLKGYPYNKYTKVYDSTGELAANKYTIDNTSGKTVVKFNTGYTPTGAVTADYVPALVVKMNIANYLPQSGGATENVQHVSGMNSFCGACHTDYNTDGTATSHNELTGTFTKAYRHTVGVNIGGSFPFKDNIANAGLPMPTETGDKLTCLTCHYAHGTNEDLWDATLASGYKGAELSGSSALKRLPNMGTCDACHQKGDSAEGYNANAHDLNAPTETAGANDPSKTYVGSTSCKSCHNDKYTGWEKSTHKTGFVGVGKQNILEDAIVNWASSNMGQAGLTPDDVLFTIGSKWKQRYIFRGDVMDAVSYGTITNRGNSGLPIATGPAVQWNPIANVWTGYNALTDKKNWSKECMSCHVTGFDVTKADQAIAADKSNLASFYAEAGTGCEACHGPGSLHIGSTNPKDIVNPKTISAARSTDVCGACHSRGGSKAYESAPGKFREDAVGFKPGMDLYGDTVNVGGIDKNIYYSKGAAGMSYRTFDANNDLVDRGAVTADANHWYTDGTEKGHHQQFEGFIISKHYLKAGMSCASCHDVHQANFSGAYQTEVNATTGGKSDPSYRPEGLHGLLKGKGATSAERATNTCGVCHGFGDQGTKLDTSYMPKVAKNVQSGDMRTHRIKVPGTITNIDRTAIGEPGLSADYTPAASYVPVTVD